MGQAPRSEKTRCHQVIKPLRYSTSLPYSLALRSKVANRDRFLSAAHRNNRSKNQKLRKSSHAEE
jgi:hypothetical protein